MGTSGLAPNLVLTQIFGPLGCEFLAAVYLEFGVGDVLDLGAEVWVGPLVVERVVLFGVVFGLCDFERIGRGENFGVRT
jgi:hypothetical protein